MKQIRLVALGATFALLSAVVAAQQDAPEP
jgi:hypothetical protein